MASHLFGKTYCRNFLAGNRIEPSQGTHFFQNLTSYGVGYFTVGAPDDGSVWDKDYINSLDPIMETKFVKVLQFDAPLVVAINGKKSKGIVLKPGIINEESPTNHDLS